jgi:transposase
MTFEAYRDCRRLRGHANILKRVLVHAGACNLGLLLRTWFGVGTPRGLQGRAAGVTLLAVVYALAYQALAVPRHLGVPPVHPLHDHSRVYTRPFVTSA